MLFEVVLTDQYPFTDKQDINAIELNALTIQELEDLLSIIRDSDKFLIVSVHSDYCKNAKNN